MAATLDIRPFLARVKSALRPAYGERLQGVVLYGSEARGAASPDSDLDLLVLLRDEVQPRDDLAALDALYPLILELERPIHASCVSISDYETGEYPLYRNAKAEGVLA